MDCCDLFARLQTQDFGFAPHLEQGYLVTFDPEHQQRSSSDVCPKISSEKYWTLYLHGYVLNVFVHSSVGTSPVQIDSRGRLGHYPWTQLS